MLDVDCLVFLLTLAILGVAPVCYFVTRKVAQQQRDAEWERWLAHSAGKRAPNGLYSWEMP